MYPSAGSTYKNQTGFSILSAFNVQHFNVCSYTARGCAFVDIVLYNPPQLPPCFLYNPPHTAYMYTDPRAKYESICLKRLYRIYKSRSHFCVWGSYRVGVEKGDFRREQHNVK